MNKAELAQKISERLNVPKKATEDFVAAFEEVITETLVNKGEVTIAGFGTFSSRVRKGRIGVNPQNPSEPITIPPVNVPKFKAGKALKDALKQAGRARGVGLELQSPAPSPTPSPAPNPTAQV
ncbi:MAG: DNA-binding protein HU [Parcubacteria group bacterium GW2011_GWA2_56_7]|nr:MAG: DNA-binding protein HU [Parcubacteria group bacterium GW2011_GWA2_56_7]